MKGIYSKLLSIPNAVKASLALFVANLISKGISYLTTPIYTRLLTPNEFGYVSLFLTWVQVFGIIAMFCLSQGVFNNGMVGHPDKRDDYSTSMLALSNLITILFAIVLFVFYPIIRPYVRLEVKYLVLMIAIFLFQPAYNFWFTRQRYELRSRNILWSSLLCTILSPTIAVGAIFCLPHNRLDARIFGAEIPLILIYFSFFLFLYKKSDFKVTTIYWKEAFLFNLPLIIHYLSMYLLSSSDRIMISNLVSDSATAYYTVAYSVASIALIIWNAVNSSLIPFTYEKCKVKKYSDISKVTLPVLFLISVASVFVIMLAPEVVFFMATKDYREAIYVIPPIVGGVFFQALYSIFANVVYYYKKPIYVTIGSVCSVSLNIVLNYFFIKRYGYIAAGYTTLFCYALQAFIDYLGMKKVVREDVYNIKVLLALSCFVILVSLLSNALYDYVVLRGIIIAVLIMSAIIFRKNIIQVFKSIKNK